MSHLSLRPVGRPWGFLPPTRLVEGLEPKFGYFVTKPAEAPKQAEKEEVVEEVKVDKAKKDLAEGSCVWGEQWSALDGLVA